IGENQFGMCVFPGKNSDAEIVLNWTPRFDSLSSIFPKLTTGGITPTGPAIREALQHFKSVRSRKGLLEAKEEHDEFGF
ncbi:hypothetical protein U5O17_17955, partial [Bacillus altitudinis]